jgi:hypothetical protein
MTFELSLEGRRISQVENWPLEGWVGWRLGRVSVGRDGEKGRLENWIKIYIFLSCTH